MFDGTYLPEPTKNLINAKRLIEERGWCQNIGEDAAGRHCILGAMHRVGALNTIEMNAMRRALDLPGNNGIDHWNNAIGRTKQDIFAAFDRAIAYSMEE
jgi:hypothetical protein